MVKVVIILLGILLLFPAYWMLNGSFQDIREIMKYPPRVIPRNPTLQNYEFLLGNTQIVRWFFNTVVVGAAALGFSLFCIATAAYALAYFEFRFKRLFYWILLIPIFLPGTVLIIPRFVIMRHLGMLNTYWPLILVGGTAPVSIVLMMHYFERLPRCLLDAARMDGLGEFSIIFRIILPQCKPLLGYFAITGFMHVYQDVLWPLLVLADESKHTMTLGMMSYLNRFHTIHGGTGSLLIGVMLAGGVVLSIPLIVMFMVFQRTFRNQFILGGINE